MERTKLRSLPLFDKHDARLINAACDVHREVDGALQAMARVGALLHEIDELIAAYEASLEQEKAKTVAATLREAVRDALERGRGGI